MNLGKKLDFFVFISLATLLVMSLTVGAENQSTPELGEDSIRSDAVKLVISTRHDSTLYQKYATYFANSELGASVGITSADEIEFFAPTTYQAFVTAMTNPSIGTDVAWGGGPTLFNNLAADGYLRTIDDADLLAWIAANVSDTLAGASMKKYDDSNGLKWTASAISSFGFTVNNKTLESRGLPFPTSWEDLASPEFYTSASQVNIAMGDAPLTTSNTRIYQIILQKFGWERGWEIIYSMAGNSNIFGGSVETRAAVERGDVAVAMTIDFYGVIAMGVNPDTQYVIPENSSIVNGDPIAISANANNLDAARAFMKYVLSAEGQAIMMDDRINRLPIREDAFATAKTLVASDVHITDPQIDTIQAIYDQTLANEGITFDEDLALSLEEAMRFHFQATITNVHTSLRDTWANIATTYNGGGYGEYGYQRLEQLVDIFGEPAITLEEAQTVNLNIGDVTFRQNIMGDWEDWAIEKYATADSEVTADWTPIITSETTDIVTTNGTTFTTTSQVTITSEATVSSVDSSITDVPVMAIWIVVGMIGPHLLFRHRKRGNRQ